MTGGVPGDLPPNQLPHTSRQVLSIATQALSRLTFRSGQVIDLRIIQQLAGGRWQVSVNGKLLSATVRFPVKPGSLLQVKVLEMPHGRVILEVVPTSVEARVASRLGFQPTSQVLLAISALMSSGMAVQAERIDEILRLLARLRRQDASTARIIAMIQDRGLKLSAEEVQQLIDDMGLSDESGFTRDNADAYDEGEKSRGQPHSGPEAEHSQRLEEADTEMTSRLAELIRYYTERMNEGSSVVGGESLLQLFNHLPAEHQHWMVVPFGYTVSDTPVQGSIRVRLRRDPAKIVADFATLLVDIPGARWAFAWALGQRRVPRRMRAFANQFTNAQNRALVNVLARIGFSLVDGIQPIDQMDGFGDTTDPLANIGTETIV